MKGLDVFQIPSNSFVFELRRFLTILWVDFTTALFYRSEIVFENITKELEEIDQQYYKGDEEERQYSKKPSGGEAGCVTLACRRRLSAGDGQAQHKAAGGGCDYNLFSVMLQMRALAIFLIFCTLAAGLMGGVAGHPVDITLSRQYHGEYISRHPGKAFGYLDHRAGDILASFYASPGRDRVDSLNLLLLDPRYQDERAVLVTLRGIVEVQETSGTWQSGNHSATLTRTWRKRELETMNAERVSTAIVFQNLDSEDYEQVSVTIQMKGEGFDFTAELKFYNQILPTMFYSMYVSAVVAVQILSAYLLLREMETSSLAAAVGGRYSLLTLAVCNILDFAQMMTHVELVMGSSSGFLFFLLPALAYLCLFIFLEMRMLFLAWKSHNQEVLESPQELRQQITSFYSKFYLGLLGYLTLNYFFAYETWMVLLRHLALLPQIAHNSRQPHRPAFNPYYIFGFIGSRLLVPIYEHTYADNRFRLAPNSLLVVTLILIFAAQAFLLFMQHRVGSKFFIPKRLRPDYFDYSYTMTAKDHAEDCAICLQGLLDGPTPAPVPCGDQPSLNQEILVQPCGTGVAVMKTPCSHKFHKECLSQWIEVKLECPACRSALPPL